MNYRDEIDGLRAVAVLAVIIAHTGLGWLPGGFAGVDVFFVISGFLITGIILRDLEQGSFRFRSFYARRVRRIFPALFVMLALSSVLAWALLSPSEIQDFSASTFYSVIFLSNGYFIDFIDYFAPSALNIPLLHTWSLAIEEQFYLLFPAIAYIAWRRFGLKGLWIAVALILLASFALSEWGWRNKLRANYFFSPSRFWEILLGSLAALSMARRKTPSNARPATIGMGAIILSFLIYDETTPFPSAYALLPTIGTVLVLVFSGGQNTASRLLRWFPLRFVGLVSFSAYLWHQPIFAFARNLELDPSIPKIALPLILVVFCVAFLSWRFVEQPFRHKSTFVFMPPRWHMPLLWFTAGALLSISVIGYASSLPVLRYPVEDRPLLDVSRLDARDYQRKIGKPFERRPFSQNTNLPKIAIIGDSYARDFLNILNEAGVLAGYDVSLWTISHKCAPFFLKGSEEESLRSIWDTSDCRDYDRYRSPKMTRSIESADTVILASKWAPWHVPFIRSTVENLQGLTNANLVLVGPKAFPHVSLRRLLRVPAAQRPDFRAQIDPELLIANDAMRLFPGVKFVSQLDILCWKGGGLCKLVAKNGRLLSQDGSHFTPTGARFMAEALGDAQGLNRLLDPMIGH